MAHKIQLTIEDRYRIVTYAHQIPSSVGVYFNFPAFIDKLLLTDEDREKYEISVMPDGKVASNSPDLIFEYDTDEFPATVMDAIKGYIESLNTTMADLREANKGNKEYRDSELYTNMVTYLKKLF